MRVPPRCSFPADTELNNSRTGRSPTTATSESPVGVANSGMPWETSALDGKYKYHPGGDPTQSPKDAPSAVNVVVIPDVNLPKVRRNSPVVLLIQTALKLTTKNSTCTTSTTSGARTATRFIYHVDIEEGRGKEAFCDEERHRSTCVF